MTEEKRLKANKLREHIKCIRMDIISLKGQLSRAEKSARSARAMDPTFRDDRIDAVISRYHQELLSVLNAAEERYEDQFNQL